MLILYFSGTGNTQYIAEKFSQKMTASCYSIEASVDFESLISKACTIVFCYPVYGSCVPMIMREFVKKYKALLKGKKLVILCTQNLFSGDGARVFIDLLDDTTYQVIYAEHINMPNNICNLFFYPLSNNKKVKRYFDKADIKIQKISDDIQNNVIKKRGFNEFSRFLGFITQRVYFQKGEQLAMKDVRINENCITCMLCVNICPMKNLTVIDERIQQRERCTLCYRCVNACPKKAITVLTHGNVKRQYLGLENIKEKSKER